MASVKTPTPSKSPFGLDLVRLSSVRDLLYVYFRHKLKILVFAAVVFSFTLLALWQQDESYTSHAKLLMRPGREHMTLDPTTETGRVVPIYREWANEMNTELEILRSQELSERVVESLGPSFFVTNPNKNLLERIPLVGGLIGWALDVMGLGKGDESKSVDPEIAQIHKHEAVQYLHKRLHVRQILKTNIFELEFRSRSPEAAQKVISKVVEFYIEKRKSIYRTAGAFMFFQSETENKQTALRNVENQLRNLKNMHGISSFADQHNAISTRIEQLYHDREQAQKNQAISRARVESLRGRINRNPLSGKSHGLILSSADYQNLQTDLRNEETSTSAFVAELSTLKQLLIEANDSVKNLNDYEIKFNQLRREREVLEKKYLEVTKKLEEARINQALEDAQISNIQMVQPATFPLDADPTYTLFKLMFALGLGVFGGLGLALASEYFDHSLARPEDIKQNLNLPALVSIPTFGSGDAGKDSDSLVPVSRWELPLEGMKHYDELRNQVLLNLNGHNKDPLILGVTSCRDGEGVSTIASNLAIAMARHSDDDRVLLVDANLQAPTAHEKFGINRSPGVAEILSGGQGHMSVIEQNLYVLSAGDPKNRDTMLVVNPKYDNLLSLIREHDYRYVVFDLPSVTKEGYTAQLAGMLDAVILVVRAESVRWEVALQAKDMLEKAQVRILGVVLNNRKFYIPKWLYQKL